MECISFSLKYSIMKTFLQIGAKKLQDVGKYLRPKYLSLFPEDGQFRQSNMRIKSSSSYRCAMSLQHFMTGFFTDNKIGWQAIPYDIDYSGYVSVEDKIL